MEVASENETRERPLASIILYCSEEFNSDFKIAHPIQQDKILKLMGPLNLASNKNHLLFLECVLFR